MSRWAVLALAAGAAIGTILVAHFGFRSVGEVLADLGWSGFIAVAVFHLLLITLMGLAWWLLGAGRADAKVRRFVWGRLIRDSASEVLPLSQVGGFVLGACALTSSGVSGSFSAASTFVDLAVELVAKLAYTLTGIGLLCWFKPGSGLVRPLIVSLLVLAVLVTFALAALMRGAQIIERAEAKFTRLWMGINAANTENLGGMIRDICCRRTALGLAFLVHLCGWLLGGIEAWMTLRLMNIPIGVGEAIVIDSLVSTVRGAAFMVPNAAGIQEGAYVVLAALFGVTPAGALSLSLVRRGRDIAIGIPALSTWGLIEGRSAVRVLKSANLSEETPSDRHELTAPGGLVPESTAKIKLR
jgi:glycosyltransferase 2 family protein